MPGTSGAHRRSSPANLSPTGPKAMRFGFVRRKQRGTDSASSRPAAAISRENASPGIGAGGGPETGGVGGACFLSLK